MDSDIEGRVRAFWEQAFNGRNLDLIDAIIDESGRAVEHDAIRDASLLRQFAEAATSLARR